MNAAIIAFKLAGGKMERIITHPTSITQWQTLVNDASQLCNMSLTEELESYLVFLLMRFVNVPQMAKKVMAIEFLTSINRQGSLRNIALRDVGDQCLLYSGLFPGRARKRLVRVSYYVNIGKTAYQSLADYSQSDSHLFTHLSNNFVNLMDILHATREINQQVSVLDPLLAQEIWQDTGSTHALQTLQQFTISTTPIILDNKDSNKH